MTASAHEAPGGPAFGYEPIDLHLARFCSDGEPDPTVKSVVFELAATVSWALRQGHPCVDLNDLKAHRASLRSGNGDDLANERLQPELSALLPALGRSRAVTVIDSALGARGALPKMTTPLVLEGRRLYAARWFVHEYRLALSVSHLMTDGLDTAVDPLFLKERLDTYFPPAADSGTDMQRLAAARAVLGKLCVVSGGPGTGKTSTVVKILALLVDLAHARGQAPPRILLVAPTGKAAARLNESIEVALERLDLSPQVARSIRPQAMTIHRALGVRADSATRFVRGSSYPLIADVVVVDEASMVDLALMRHICEALAPSTHLVVLGDRYQLASVEAGSVFSDLCSALSLAQTDLVDNDGARSSCLVELSKSYRFAEDSGIFKLSRAVQTGDPVQSTALFSRTLGDVQFHPSIEDDTALESLLALAEARYEQALLASSPLEALEMFARFRVLCAHRKGPFGVDQLNDAIARRLVSRGRLSSATVASQGQLLMILENDSSLGIHNGDVAVLWPGRDGRLSACFAEGTRVRYVSPAQLPAHQLCFAMTVHKSQGSEYDDVALVLPRPQSPLLSRELVYTAVTRAKKRVYVYSSQESLTTAVTRVVLRRSGLTDRLLSLLSDKTSASQPL